MSSFLRKNCSYMGYQKSGSFESSNFKKDKGVENASNITMIKVVDMMLDNITMQGRYVIRSVIAIGHVPVEFAGGRKIRRTVVIEDAESNQLDCTFWEHWATMWDESAQKRNELGHMVFILQLGKVKYSDVNMINNYDMFLIQLLLLYFRKPAALRMQGFIYSIKRMGRHIPPARNATGKWMLWRVKLSNLRVKARLPFTMKSMVQF
nr:replication protein A 70 kDa DNA-binding subunit B [Tanacetum cinerariifolium]